MWNKFASVTPLNNTVFWAVWLKETRHIKFKTPKSAFTCNPDEISSRDETRPGLKKFLFTREFHPEIK